ncbi:MAG: chemotaxis protein CheW [Holosporales bacterium]
MTENIEIQKSSTPQQILTFTVANEEYGVDIMAVREIKGWTEATRLPNTQPYMRGVINLRGLIIPIFDVKARLGGELTHATPKHVVIILAVGARNVGLLVDAVSDILDVNSDQIKASPTGEEQTTEDYVTGLISLENRMVVLMDVGRLLHKEPALAHIDTLEDVA